MEKAKKKRGFTLVELIVVLVILAVLAALLVPALTGYIDKAKKSQVIAETRILHTAIQTEMSELYAKPEWQNFSTDMFKRTIAMKDSPDATIAERYNEITSLSELSSLSNNGTGSFGAYITDTGKVGLLVYYDGKGYVGVYVSQTQEYLAYTVEEAPHYSYYTYGVIYVLEYVNDTEGKPYYNELLRKDLLLGTILK